MSTILSLSEPTSIIGDSPIMAFFPGFEDYLTNDNKCSGWCGEYDEVGDSEDPTIIWPPNTPMPDDPDAIPRRCCVNNCPELKPNLGRPNHDPLVSLSPSVIQDNITKPWKGDIKINISRPVIIYEKQ